MGTEVLRPQDILGERFRQSPAPFPRRKSYFQNGNGNNFNYGYQKKKINNYQPRHPQELLSSNNNKADNLNRSNNVNSNGKGGVVTILRRGESVDYLNPKIKRENNNNRTKKENNVYAGSVCSFSPSPSSLPLPSFFKKQESNSIDDSATRDLRRLLRLE